MIYIQKLSMLIKNSSMTTINLIGSGNVAWHLLQYIENNSQLALQNWYARNHHFEIKDKSKICKNIQDLKPAAITILAVSDDAISLISSELPFLNELVVHTSGTKSIEEINPKNRIGVFYPLQTFSKNKEVDFSKIPIGIEANNHNDLLFLEQFAGLFSNKVSIINSNQRVALHIAAVFACNFTNLMYQKAYKICEENQLDFDFLLPLIQETAEKVKTINPMLAQTGPAKRGDIKTLEKHEKFLENTSFLELYKKLTEEINKE